MLMENITQLETLHKQGKKKNLPKLLQERKKLESIEITQIQKNLIYMKQMFLLTSPKAITFLSW